MLRQVKLAVLPLFCMAGIGLADTITTPVPPPTPAPFLFAKPDALIFRQTGTVAPPSQMVNVTVRKGTLGALTTSTTGGTWLTATASGGTVIVSVNTTGTTSGTHLGSVQISADGFTSVTVKVILIILGSNIQAVPETLNLHAVLGGQADAKPREINVFTPNGSAFNWTASSDMPWLVITPASGSGKSTIQISLDLTQITAAGNFAGRITVNDTTNSTSDTVTVNLTVDAPKPPDFEMGPWLHEPGVLNFDAETSASTPAPKIFYGRNLGGDGSLSFTLTVTVNSPTGGNWITVSPLSNTTPGKTTVTVNPSGLPPGNYSATISGTATAPAGVAGGTLTSKVMVYLTVEGNPSVRVDHRFLRFTASTKQAPPVPSPASQTLTFITKSTAGYPFTATVTTNKGGNWLSVTPASGTAKNGGTVTVSILAAAIAGLAPGYYTGQVELDYSGGAPKSEETVGVGLRIFGPNDAPRLTVSPGGMIFVATEGGANPASKNANVRAEAVDASGLKYTVSVAVSTPSGGTWLSAGSAGGTATSTPAPVPVNVTLGSLKAGMYTGTVTFIPDPASNAPSQVVYVMLIVKPAGAAATAETVMISSSGSPITGSFAGILATGALVASVTDPPDGFSTSTDAAMGVTVTVTDSSGTPVPGANVVMSSSNGEPDVTLDDNGDGTYSGLFQPESSGPVTLSASAQASDNTGMVFEAADATVSGVVVAAGDVATPVYTSGAIGAASYAPQPTPITPGSLISLFGYNIAGGGGAASSLPLPASLNGVSVTVGGIPAPLIVSVPASVPGGNDQINLQVPFELSGQTSADIVVTANGVAGAPETVALGTAPAFFTVNSAGTGDGIFVHSDGITLITPGNPAGSGEVIVLYGTGLGDVQSAVASGSPFMGPDTVAGSVQVTIGGQPAKILYAGGLPGYAGVYQLNVVVPANLPSGENTVMVFVNNSPATGQATVALQ